MFIVKNFKKFFIGVLVISVLGSAFSDKEDDEKTVVLSEKPSQTIVVKASASPVISSKPTQKNDNEQQETKNTSPAKAEESKPSLTPEQAFRENLKQYNYVGSSESDKYHKPSCRWTSKINDSNLVHFDTKDEATAAGYSPCGTCNP